LGDDLLRKVVAFAAVRAILVADLVNDLPMLVHEGLEPGLLFCAHFTPLFAAPAVKSQPTTERSPL